MFELRHRPMRAIALVVMALALWATSASAQVATFDHPETIGAPFELVDETGRTVSDKAFRGHMVLLYFGYSYCPDLCPMTLSVLSQALDVLQDNADKVSVVFVSVDPDRDTPKRLREFIAMYHPNFKALVGDANDIRALADSYRVIYKRHEVGEGDYVIDHSSLTYLMDGNGGFLAAFMHGTSPERIAAEIESRL